MSQIVLHNPPPPPKLKVQAVRDGLMQIVGVWGPLVVTEQQLERLERELRKSPHDLIPDPHAHALFSYMDLTFGCRAVSCSSCGSERGEPCRAMSGRNPGRALSYTHAARGRRYQRSRRARNAARRRAVKQVAMPKRRRKLDAAQRMAARKKRRA